MLTGTIHSDPQIYDENYFSNKKNSEVPKAVADDDLTSWVNVVVKPSVPPEGAVVSSLVNFLEENYIGTSGVKATVTKKAEALEETKLVPLARPTAPPIVSAPKPLVFFGPARPPVRMKIEVEGDVSATKEYFANPWHSQLGKSEDSQLSLSVAPKFASFSLSVLQFFFEKPNAVSWILRDYNDENLQTLSFLLSQVRRLLLTDQLAEGQWAWENVTQAIQANLYLPMQQVVKKTDERLQIEAQFREHLLHIVSFYLDGLSDDMLFRGLPTKSFLFDFLSHYPELGDAILPRLLANQKYAVLLLDNTAAIQEIIKRYPGYKEELLDRLLNSVWFDTAIASSLSEIEFFCMAFPELTKTVGNKLLNWQRLTDLFAIKFYIELFPGNKYTLASLLLTDKDRFDALFFSEDKQPAWWQITGFCEVFGPVFQEKLLTKLFSDKEYVRILAQSPGMLDLNFPDSNVRLNEAIARLNLSPVPQPNFISSSSTNAHIDAKAIVPPAQNAVDAKSAPREFLPIIEENAPRINRQSSSVTQYAKYTGLLSLSSLGFINPLSLFVPINSTKQRIENPEPTVAYPLPPAPMRMHR